MPKERTYEKKFRIIAAARTSGYPRPHVTGPFAAASLDQMVVTPRLSTISALLALLALPPLHGGSAVFLSTSFLSARSFPFSFVPARVDGCFASSATGVAA